MGDEGGWRRNGKEWVMRGQNMKKVGPKKQVDGPKQDSEQHFWPQTFFAPEVVERIGLISNLGLFWGHFDK